MYCIYFFSNAILYHFLLRLWTTDMPSIAKGPCFMSTVMYDITSNQPFIGRPSCCFSLCVSASLEVCFRGHAVSLPARLARLPIAIISSHPKMAIMDYYLPRLIWMHIFRLAFRLVVYHSRRKSGHFPKLPPPSRSQYYASHGRSNRIDIFLTDGKEQAGTSPTLLPIYINLHGGGFCLPTRG